MRKFVNIFGLGFIILLAIGFAVLKFIVWPKADRDFNPVAATARPAITKAQSDFHKTLRVADLHADSLLWRRNLRARNDYGHADFPRLREGGVRLQVFSAVTKSPRGLNFDNNDGNGPDDITKLAVVQLWPVRTWGSIYERAAYQAQRLQKIERKSKGAVKIARTGADISAAIGSPEILIAILEIEGAHPLEGELDNITRLYDEGYRMMGLQHFFDNELGGSMHGRTKAGLSEFGRAAVQQMSRQGIIIDVAHSSAQSVRDTLAITDAPLVLSHGGVLSACPRTQNRNLPDEILIEMAARGSLIGIGYFEGVICDISPAGIADALIYAVNLLGEDSVALGSDFDGTVTTSLDTSELSLITASLMEKGMAPQVIAKVMGENAIAFFTQNLPRVDSAP